MRNICKSLAHLEASISLTCEQFEPIFANCVNVMELSGFSKNMSISSLKHISFMFMIVYWRRKRILLCVGVIRSREILEILYKCAVF